MSISPPPFQDRLAGQQAPKNRGQDDEEDTGPGVIARARGRPGHGVERRGVGGIECHLHARHGHHAAARARVRAHGAHVAWLQHGLVRGEIMLSVRSGTVFVTGEGAADSSS